MIFGKLLINQISSEIWQKIGARARMRMKKSNWYNYGSEYTHNAWREVTAQTRKKVTRLNVGLITRRSYDFLGLNHEGTL